MALPIMPKIEWDPNYTVGVQRFDEAHLLLIDALNDLRDSLMGKKGKEVVAQVLERLMLYAHEHFIDEEVILLNTDYPKYDEHRAEHDKFISEVRGYYVRLHAGESDSRMLSAEITATVTDHFLDHTLVKDKEYVPHLKAKGIK